MYDVPCVSHVPLYSLFSSIRRVRALSWDAGCLNPSMGGWQVKSTRRLMASFLSYLFFNLLLFLPPAPCSARVVVWLLSVSVCFNSFLQIGIQGLRTPRWLTCLTYATLTRLLSGILSG